MSIKNLIDWPAIYSNPAFFHIYLTERKRGKTSFKAREILEEIITKGNNYRFCWMRRRWHDSLDSSRPYFSDLCYQFCEEKKLRHSLFEVKEKGVRFGGEKRIWFFDLFHFAKARGAIAKIEFKEIIFEEAIPIDQEFLTVRDKTEQWMFKDLIDSLKGRIDKSGTQTKITFLANPYFWSCWFLDVFNNLFNLKAQAEKKAKEGDNSGVLEIKKDEEGVEWLLYLNLIEGEDDPQSRALREKINPSLVNWDEFMFSLYTSSGKLKRYKIEHAIQDYFFCELGQREKEKRFFFLHFTKNKKEVAKEIINYCFSLEEKAKSRLLNCVIEDKKETVEQWVDMLKENMLFFADFRSRDWFLELIRSG